MTVNQEYEVKIEKMMNDGNGLARIDGMPVFIDNVCPEDTVKIKINKINKSYMTADVVEIINPSKYRVEPLCKMHNICGSCNWQHIDYNKQLKEKQNIVFETIKKITGTEYKIEDTIPSPKNSCYRCKIQYPVSQRQQGRIISGYYKKNSHDLINIKYCPMHNPVISEICEFIKDEMQKLNISAYIEKNHLGLVRHIIFRHSSDLKSIIVIFVINSDAIDKKLRLLGEKVIQKYGCIKGVCANFNTKKTNVIMGECTKSITGDSFYIEELEGLRFKVSANSFFQVNPYCAVNIFNKVKEMVNNCKEKPSVLDAYSGVSSFGIWLSSSAKNVTCIEEEGSASCDAKDNIRLNNCNNIEIINGDAAVRFKELIKEGRKFDISVTDPPRKGCSNQALDALIKLTDKYIIYVSCNVSTLSRDIKYITENSHFRPVSIQPVDMFPNTCHIETIVLFKKVK